MPMNENDGNDDDVFFFSCVSVEAFYIIIYKLFYPQSVQVVLVLFMTFCSGF